MFLSLETSWCQNPLELTLATESQMQNLELGNYVIMIEKKEGSLMNPFETFIKVVNIPIDISFCIFNHPNAQLH